MADDIRVIVNGQMNVIYTGSLVFMCHEKTTKPRRLILIGRQ